MFENKNENMDNSWSIVVSSIYIALLVFSNQGSWVVLAPNF